MIFVSYRFKGLTSRFWGCSFIRPKLYVMTAKLAIPLMMALCFATLSLTNQVYAQEHPGRMDPASQQKFVDPLPIPAVMQPARPGGTHYVVRITQFQQDLGLKDHMGRPLLTTVWGYNGTYPGASFEVEKGKPITVEWINALQEKGKNLKHLLPVDETIHWAAPMGWPNSGVPIVTHLHGGHTEAASDGYPDAWYTPNYEQKGCLWTKNIYTYNNDQDATTLWYHDHALGLTRLNVYAGLAGFYILRDSWEARLKLPRGKYEIPIAIQDRNFTKQGQLFYPAVEEEEMGPMMGNASKPSVMPEMFGDHILVNGKLWPVLDVEPRQYRLRMLNGSDSRFYNLHFDKPSSPTFTQIGSDGGFLNAPIKGIKTFLIGPGERKDMIIDFEGYDGQVFILRNDANAPYPDGDIESDEHTSQIMMIRVGTKVTQKDRVVLPSQLRPSPISAYAEPANKNKRSLLLLESTDEFGRLKPMLGTLKHGEKGWFDPVTETPLLNEIEEWTVYNITPDAHPVHLHLVNFQVVERLKFNAEAFVNNYQRGRDMTAFGAITGPSDIPLLDEDKGWKDTEIVYPGEVVRLRAKFDLPGLYVWHCHILSHEDHEMMRPVYVKSTAMEMIPDIACKTGHEETHPISMNAYPNPFVGQLNIDVQVQKSGKYVVEVYNLNGLKLKSLSNNYWSNGKYQVKWNGDNDAREGLPKGWYVIRVTNDKNVITKKVWLDR